MTQVLWRGAYPDLTPAAVAQIYVAEIGREVEPDSLAGSYPVTGGWRGSFRLVDGSRTLYLAASRAGAWTVSVEDGVK
jgi:hypothetical protein